MNNATKARKKGPSAFLLAEEAVQLLLQTGLVAMSIYAIGSVPFVLGLIAYAGTMAHSGLAHHYLGTGALGLTMLFLWMKVFHARFSQHVRARLTDSPLSPWTLKQFFTTLCRQSFIQATAVLVYPVAFLTIIPIGYSMAFYQNASVLDDGRVVPLRTFLGEVMTQVRRWPKQNHLLLWLCSPVMVCVGAAIALGTFPIMDSLEDNLLVSLGGFYGTILLILAFPLAPFAVMTVVNVGVGFFVLIEFFHIFTGADTLISRSPEAVVGNDLFIACACGVAYLLLDPVLKSAYAIRCFEGESLRTGADLRVILHRIRKTLACLLLVAVAATALPAMAEAPTSDTSINSLNDAIDKELAERRYTWRMPRETQPDVEMPWLLQMFSDFAESVRGWVKAGWDFITDLIERIWDWFFGDDEQSASAGSPRSFTQSLGVLVKILVVLLLGVITFLIWRSFANRPSRTLIPTTTLSENVPDLHDEATSAADLPEDEWYALARELAGKGDFRLASRALFFSILATLASKEIIRIARFKSNMDYDYEMRHRAAAIGNAPQLFAQSTFLYESVWYGEHEANAKTLEDLHAFQSELRHGLS